MLAFGPVPSRRLGRSLGVNNIAPKFCTYACIYCQVGRTTKLSLCRQTFYSPKEIFHAVKRKIEEAKAANAPIDFVTFVPDGEPTLDINIGQEISILKKLGLKIAVITNASLFFDPDIRAQMVEADWVSLKIDALEEDTWRRINRPHGKLVLQDILDGIFVFAQTFTGELVTETMLVRGVNDDMANLKAIASFLERLRPIRAYISIPTRPPAEIWSRSPTEEAIHQAYQIFKKHVKNVEFLIDYEGNDFAITGDAAKDLLSITAVHPMRQDAVTTFLQTAGVNEPLVENLIKQGLLTKKIYHGHYYYLRRFPMVTDKEKEVSR